MPQRYAHALGALVAALLPLHAALTRIALLVPIGSDATRQHALAALLLGASCASVFVLLDVAIARVTRAFELAPAVRAPLALGLTWVVLSEVLALEPVIARCGPVALLAALIIGCAALRFRVSTERLIAVLERARGRGATEHAPSRLSLLAACTFMALGALYLRGATVRVAEIRSDAQEALQEALLFRAAPRSVLMLSDELARSSLRAIADARPDIELIEARALFDVRGAEALAAQRPELMALIRSSLLRGTLDVPELQALAAQRPVRLALDLEMLAGVREVLVPAGLFSEVATSSVTSSDLSLARSSGDAQVQSLLGELALGELDTPTRAWVRDQCVLTAALLAPLSRGAYLAEYLDRARLFTRGEREKRALGGALATMGIPAGVAQ